MCLFSFSSRPKSCVCTLFQVIRLCVSINPLHMQLALASSLLPNTSSWVHNSHHHHHQHPAPQPPTTKKSSGAALRRAPHGPPISKHAAGRFSTFPLAQRNPPRKQRVDLLVRACATHPSFVLAFALRRLLNPLRAPRVCHAYACVNHSSCSCAQKHDAS